MAALHPLSGTPTLTHVDVKPVSAPRGVSVFRFDTGSRSRAPPAAPHSAGSKPAVLLPRSGQRLLESGGENGDHTWPAFRPESRPSSPGAPLGNMKTIRLSKVETPRWTANGLLKGLGLW